MTLLEKLPISVCMMAGNEESRIAHALQSVVDWVDEIIVVLDARSTDQTEKIALSFGAKVFREPWKGMIGQSNSALQKCTRDWIFGLDADEVVSDELRRSIVRFFLSGRGSKNSLSGLKFSRRTWFMGRWILHGDWYPDTQLRLFLKGKGAWGGKEPHHKAVVNGKVGRLEGDLLHYSHLSFSDYLLKMDSFSRRAVVARDLTSARNKEWTISARAVWRFFRAFVIRRGFLDGPLGFYLALSQSFFTAHRHWSLREAAMQSSAPQPHLFGVPPNTQGSE
jgi:glycosyltransferase involved in cell wall biosynthesis